MTIVQEDQILKIQLSDDGRIWFADGVENPTVSTQNLAEFVSEISERDGLHIRVIGTAVNAPLIVALYQQCCSPRRPGRLEVASPLVCETTEERRDPTIALYRMRQCLLSASLGGWHQVDELDYPSYAIAAQLARDGGYSEHVKRLLLMHPAYHDLTFISTLSQESAAKLIAMVLDPRWFADIENPYRLSRLKTYLGLTPRYMQRILHNNTASEPSRRAALTLRAWQGIGHPNESEMQSAGNFLWRRFDAAGGAARGNLRATQAFVTFFIRTWQQQLFSKSRQRLEMFIPDNLLKGAEVPAYKAHADRRPV